jgi:perosamine synthetase
MIRVAEPVLDGNETAYVMECLRTNWISSRGTFIERFEQLLADYCGVEHAVVTCNGTTSLHLALVANGIGPGDEVIMPTLSYVDTANVATYCHAVPVFVDCEPKYLCMDPEKIEAAITPRTKAIMTVPLYGHPVNMDPILAIAERHGLAVVEDAAESLGAEYKGRRVGSLSRCASFSFLGTKPSPRVRGEQSQPMMRNWPSGCDSCEVKRSIRTKITGIRKSDSIIG